MREISIRDAREGLKSLIDRVGSGEEVMILRHGRPVARLGPPPTRRAEIPGLAEFRETNQVQGLTLCEGILAEREKNRS